MARTNLSVDRKVFEEFSAQADRKNMTLFAFANESLSAISKISAEGGDPGEMYRIWRVLTILRQVDVITLPSDFVEELVVRLYAADKETTMARFRELGSSLVGLLKMATEDLAGLSDLAQDFGTIIPIKRFRMATLKDGKVEVDVVGAGKGTETTVCSSEFLKSILNGYGYDVVKEEIHAGAIRLWAEKRNWG
jgi:hypothetical protein